MHFSNAGRKVISILFLASCGPALIAAQSAGQAPTNIAGDSSYAQRANLAIQSLQKWYDLQTGLYKTTGWWNSANVITTLADYSKGTQSDNYDYIFSNTLAAAQKKFPGIYQ